MDRKALDKGLPVVYAMYYGRLKTIAKEFGYALALHGSLSYDMDIVLIPWAEEYENPMVVIQAFSDEIGYRDSRLKPYLSWEKKPNGRYGFTIAGGGHGHLDVSVVGVPSEIWAALEL